VTTTAGGRGVVWVHPTETINAVKTVVEDWVSISPQEQRIAFNGNIVEDSLPLSECDIADGSNLFLLNRLRLRKPVIYLFSPTPFMANVRVSLVPAWTFHVTYPAAPVERGIVKNGQSVAWDVDLQDNASLYDKRTKTEVSYLFWEAM